MKTTAVIVAAGAGKRIGGSLPKQFVEVAGRPILFYTLRKFEACPLVQDMVVVGDRDRVDFIRERIVEPFGFKKVRTVVPGGRERQDSVLCGLAAVDASTEFVAVHDAVRPFVTVEKISEVIRAGARHGAAVLAVPPRDTIKRAQGEFVVQTLPRETLWSVQTPQVFKVAILREALEQASREGALETDDATAVEKWGCKVKIVPGNFENFKITVPFDLKVAEALLREEK